MTRRLRNLQNDNKVEVRLSNDIEIRDDSVWKERTFSFIFNMFKQVMISSFKVMHHHTFAMKNVKV